MPYEKIELTGEQMALVLENWDKMTFTDLVRFVFQDKKLDGRTLEGKAIKEFMEERKSPKKKNIKNNPIELTDEDREFIKNNLRLRPIELTKIIFKDVPKIEPLGRHVAAVNKYKMSVEDTEGDHSAGRIYKPPLQISQVLNKVNEFVGKDMEYLNLTAVQRRNLDALRTFMKSPRFLTMINSYVSMKSRNLFEQEFVRAIHDKPDLTPDELNLYINLCQNYVLMTTINRQLDMLNERYENIMLDPDSKITTPFADMIKAKTDELNKCDKRQSELIESLNGKRRDRVKEGKNVSANIVNLIEWWREFSERSKAFAWAQKESEEAAEEIDRLESLPDVKARILGLSKSELLHG